MLEEVLAVMSATPFWWPSACKRLVLPEYLRSLLASIPPHARLDANPTDRGIVAAIGDYVVENVLSAGLRPTLIVFDCRTLREKRKCPSIPADYTVIRVENPRSMLSVTAVRAVSSSLRRGLRTALVVDGEEDLLALPSILETPIGSKVVYGYPGVASVIVEATCIVKSIVYSIVREMVCIE